jgi:hypothetical protein
MRGNRFSAFYEVENPNIITDRENYWKPSNYTFGTNLVMDGYKSLI